MKIFQKLWQHRHDVRSLPQTIWFNFRFLPLSQAVHLPILLYKPRLMNCTGTVEICGGGSVTA